MKKETFLLRFLYRTIAGRCVLNVLVKPGVSRMAARYLESPFSKWLVPFYVRKYSIDLNAFEKKTYDSFQDFFVRKRKSCGLQIDGTRGHLISPCDGLLSVYRIGEKDTWNIKHVEYSLSELLKDEALANRYRGGICMVFRLTPAHYHRYCYVDDGRKESEVRIPGILHCVRPIAYETGPVFVQNSRSYTMIHTRNFGDVIQMEVGALLVGEIHNHWTRDEVLRGEEKGYFKFGGSTIILLLEKNRILPDKRIRKNMKWGRETEVILGERVAMNL